MIYLTQEIGNEFGKNEPRVEADNWIDAVLKCPPGYEIIGQLIHEIEL